MNPTRIHHGTYTAKGGKKYAVEILYDPDRLHGLKEWCRKAIANGGKATKADGAFTLTIKEKP